MRRRHDLKGLVIPLIIFGGIFGQNAFAQTMPENAKVPGFIKTRHNKIIRADSLSLARFYSLLDTLVSKNNRKVNILHIGDSHIQADFFTGRMRDLFQQQPQFGNGGRGFVFPYALARSRSGIDIKTESQGNWKGCKSVTESNNCYWGLAGIVASSHDSVADITFKLPAKGQYSLNKFTLFCPPHVSHEYQWQHEPTVGGLRYAGYNIRAGGFDFIGSGQDQECRLTWIRKPNANQPFVLQGCWMENASPGIIYSALGVNGAEAYSFLRCQDLQKHVKFVKPDLVIVSLGTNDAFSRNFVPEVFYKNLGELIQRIKMAAPEADVLLTTPGDNLIGRKYLNRRNDLARRQILKLAEETGSAVWDLYSIMGGLGSMNTWVRNGLAQKDKVHFTVKGYKLQGDLLYQAIMEQYLNHKLNRLSALR